MSKKSNDPNVKIIKIGKKRIKIKRNVPEEEETTHVPREKDRKPSDTQDFDKTIVLDKIGSNNDDYEIIKSSDMKKNKKKGFKKMSAPKKILVVCACFIGICVLAGFGVIFTWMLQAPPLDLKNFDYASTTKVYDINGKEYQTLQGLEMRVPATIDEIPEMVQLAFISIEDQRFYSHSGVDIRGTAKAIVSVLTSGSTDGPGGSTITQQLIKQTHLTSEVSIKRKVMEWKLAFQLEHKIGKREIMEAYLNKVNMSITWGIESAAQTYFGKSADELSVAQSAVLASIINAPAYYNPYKYVKDEDGNSVIQRTKLEDGSLLVGYDDDNKERSLQVISKMKFLGHINEREYEIAKDQLENNKIGLILPKVSTTYTYFTDAVYEQVLNDIMKKYNYTQDDASDLLLNGGLKIYSTVDPVIQKTLEKEAKNPDNFPPQSSSAREASRAESKKTGEEVNYLPQLGGSVIENETGYVSGIIGGREKTGSLTLNRSLQKQQVGSTTKPISVYSPGIDTGVLTMASTFDNVRLNFGGWKVVNTPATYTGMTSCRQGIVGSINVVAVLAQNKVGFDVSADYAEKFGFEIVREGDVNDMNAAALALGGYTYGQTPLALASAYTVFPNGGYRITPTFYTKVENSDGVTILTPEQETVQVISEECAWIMTDALKQVVRGGTTTRSVPGQEMGGKTGTTDAEMTTWFAGFTPKYTAAFWWGYDKREVTIDGHRYKMYINMGGGGWRGPAAYWEKVFRQFYKEKKIPDAKFKPKPDGVIRAAVDGVSGKAPTALSSKDPRGSKVHSEYFIKGFYPKESDDMHVAVEVCAETGLLANEYCPKETRVLIKKDPKKLYPPGTTRIGSGSGAETGYLVPTKTCTVHSKNSVVSGVIFNAGSSITLNTGETATLGIRTVTGSGNITPTGGSTSYTSSSPSVVSVSNNGTSVTVSANAPGSSTVKAIYTSPLGQTYTASIEVVVVGGGE